VAGVVSAAAPEPLGSAAEEAARLVDSLQGWFGAPPPAPEDTTDGAGERVTDGERAATAGHPATCRSCPLCRGVAALERSHPEVLAHLSGAAQHLAAALRALTDPAPSDPAPGDRAHDPARDPAAADPAADPSGARPAGRPTRAVRIDVEPDPERDLSRRGPSEQEPT
jgi:hypothetical protein